MVQARSTPERGHEPSSRRERVRREVSDHVTSDPREAVARESILELLDTLADPFDQHSDLRHLTGSALLAGPRGTVLHVHRRLGKWLQPGGHLLAGEHPSEAALREAEEETGLMLSHPGSGPRLLHLDVHAAAAGHTHLDLLYLLVAPDADPSPSADESPLVGWFGWDEAEAVADDALGAAIAVARLQPEVAGSVRRPTRA